MLIHLRTNESLNSAGSCMSEEENKYKDLSKEEIAGLCNLLSDTETKDNEKSRVSKIRSLSDRKAD